MANMNCPGVTIDDFKNIIKAQMIEGNTRPIFGLGLGGIGKSEAIMNLAEELGIGYVDIRLLLYNETDLKGIPYPNADHTKTVWLQNSILPTVETHGEKGILVFDEVTSCMRSVRTAAYQLLNERKLGEYSLPDGWLVVCLGNGIDDGGDFNGMEGNFLNRCSVYDILPSVNTWCDWALENDINPLITGYIRFKSDDFHTFSADNDMELFASPRSWKAVSDILKYNDINDKITQYRIMGSVGVKVGQTFMAFSKFENVAVKAEDILEGKAKHNIKDKEALMITVSSLVKLVRDELRLNKGIEPSEELIEHIANTINWLIDLKCDGAAETKLMAFKDMFRANDTVLKIIMNPKFASKCTKFKEFVASYKNIFK